MSDMSRSHIELAAAIVNLHNETKGLFVSPNVAHIYLRPEMGWKDQVTTTMEAIDSLRQLFDAGCGELPELLPDLELTCIDMAGVAIL